MLVRMWSNTNSHTLLVGKQNDTVHLDDHLAVSVGAQYASGGQWRNNSRKNEGMEPKQKQYPAVDVTGVESKI